MAAITIGFPAVALFRFRSGGPNAGMLMVVTVITPVSADVVVQPGVE